MDQDMVIAEVRKARRALHEEAGDDLHTYFDKLREAAGKYDMKRVDRLPGRSAADRAA